MENIIFKNIAINAQVEVLKFQYTETTKDKEGKEIPDKLVLVAEVMEYDKKKSYNIKIVDCELKEEVLNKKLRGEVITIPELILNNVSGNKYYKAQGEFLHNLAK